MSADKTTETWIYVGRRRTSKSLGFGFVEAVDDEKAHVFNKRPNTISYTPAIGSEFEVEVERQDDGTVLRPARSRDRADDAPPRRHAGARSQRDASGALVRAARSAARRQSRR